MRPTDIATIRAQALRTLATVDARGLALLIADERNGYSSGGLDVPGGSSEDTPTERAALAPDSAAEALKDLDRIMRTLQRAVDELDHMHTMWTAQPRKALCSHCGDPSGSFAKALCRWCASWLADTHQLPPMKEVIARQSGTKRNARRPKADAA